MINKKKEANYIFASKLLDELNIEDKSEKKYEELKDGYLEGKVSLESWFRYWDEHKEEEENKNTKKEIEEQLYENDFVWTNIINQWNDAKKISKKEYKKHERLIFFGHANNKIKGKAQIIDNEKKKNVILMTLAEKENKETKQIEKKIKYIGEGFDKRFDGQPKEYMDKSYWVYTVVDDGEEYVMFSEKKLESSEIHIFYGMTIKANNSNELLKDFKCKGIKNLFFCKEYQPLIKAMPKNQIIEYTGKFILDNNIDKNDFTNFFFDVPFTHFDGNIYRQPEDYMMLRHAQLLSGKVDGYPLSMLSLGVPGCSKTIELECMDHLFQEGIMEAGNSTPKALVPSFKEKPASPGFIMSRNRIALIDEFMKMVDKQIDSGNGSTTVMKNQISELNMILEHKRRSVGSGNDNSFVGQSTSKTIMVGNPSSRYSYLHDHIKILDESTLSRLFIWVKDNEHKNFVRKNKVIKSQDTYKTYTHILVCDSDSVSIGKVFGDLVYQYYLSVYDSCQAFICEIDDKKVSELFKDVQALCDYRMDNIWASRGLHHTRLIIDGITKFRCIFKDLDDSFVANNDDYEMAQKILIRMVNSWGKEIR